MTGPPLLRRSSSVLTRRTGRSVVALGADGAPVVLRDTALAVWTAFAQPGTVAQIAADLARVYGAAPGALAADVEVFAHELVAAGLLEPEE